MKNFHYLNEIGIKNPLELFGTLDILKNSSDSLIIFLFDEHHGNENDCIIKNIDNANTLISTANIDLIGVESLAGGKEWDVETEDYVEDNLNEKYYKEITLREWKSGCTTFSDNINSRLIFGVESVGMMDKIETDWYNKTVVENINCDMNTFIINHTLTRLRSRHFVKTMFEEYSSRQFTGNMILNCGSNHIDHIQEWIRNDEIDEIVGSHATYVRINNL